MSEIVKGKVTAVVEKQTSVGTMYDVTIGGVKVGAGKYMPKVREGGYYKVEITRNGNYVNLARGAKFVEVTGDDAKEDAPRAASPAQQVYRGGGTFGDDKKQETISKQAARNTAIEFMKLLGEKDALVMPAASAKPAARYDALRATLEQLTEEFYSYSMGKTASANPVDAKGNEVPEADPNDFD